VSHAVITGSTRGIGLGMARRFLQKGHRVTLNGSSQASVDKALAALKAEFPGAPLTGFAADLSQPGTPVALWNAAAALAPIDYWLNNHGVTQSALPFTRLTMDEARRVIAINLTGMIEASQVAINGFAAQGHGTLYNMEGFGSNGMVNPHMTLYGTSKAALTYFTKALIAHTKGTPVKVCWLNPGMVTTDLLLHDLPPPGVERERLVRMYNILADRVETVAPWLADRILENPQHGSRVVWLTNGKAAWRFMTAAFVKRDVVSARV